MIQTLKTRSESALKTKLQKKSGFTLAELLIVIAIIAILAAIAIPLYTTQMENARRRVDESTLASATSMAVSDYLINEYTTDMIYEVYQGDGVGDAGNRSITVVGGATKPTATDAPTDYGVYDFQSDYTSFNITITTGGAIKTSTIT